MVANQSQKPMKTQWLGLLLGLLFSVEAGAEDALVWRVEQGANQLFLAGSIHVLRESDLPLPAALNQIYSQSDVLALEADLGQLEGAEFVSKVQQQALRADAKTLQQRLQPETWQRLQHYCEQRAIPLQSLQPLKTSLALLTLLTVELQRTGFGLGGVDQRFYQRASAEQKPMRYLETLDQQLAVLMFTDEQEHDSYVNQTLDDLEDFEAEINSLIKAWRAGDEAVIEAQLIEPLKQRNPLQYQAMLVQRNQNWIAALEQWLKTPETEMVLVGAAHLLGPESVVAMLQQRGYKVSRVQKP